METSKNLGSNPSGPVNLLYKEQAPAIAFLLISEAHKRRRNRTASFDELFGVNALIGTTGAAPSNPPNSIKSPSFPTGISRTPVVLSLMTPIAHSSAIIPAIVSAGVAEGMHTMSSPTEHTDNQCLKFLKPDGADADCFGHSSIFANRYERATETPYA